MTSTQFNRHTFPRGGWLFRQIETNWITPTPLSSTFDQTVQLIIAMRRKNPAITQKYHLATDTEAVASELERYTRKRLGLPQEATPLPFPESRSNQNPGVGDVAGAAGSHVRTTVAFAPRNEPPRLTAGQSKPLPVRVDRSVVQNLKRAAKGTAVVLDWLTSGGAPVAQELANKRAAICAACPQNVPGSWYTEAPAEIIKTTLEARKDLKLETPHDGALQSCNICRCLNRLKVWCPMDHIQKRTAPEIMAEFPKENCWIANKDE